jgi:class 3 adenylate cyclase/tetratricopeptide (TPR) repeat protein
VTFLFTDLVSSTEILERLGDDAAEVLRRMHFGLLRGAVAETGGEEVKNLGDGLMVVFASPLEALRCAMRIQQEVEGHNRSRPDLAIGVRIGLHAGEPLRDENDFFGTSVVVAKRLCDKAAGAQILVSELVAGLVGSRGGLRFESVGKLDLKGLAQPMAALELRWRPNEEPAGPDQASVQQEESEELALPSLPVQITSRSWDLVGRDEELDRLLACFDRAAGGVRQVALLGGEPGIGKTRLAIEIARRAHEDGAIVLYGRSDEELGVPYQPFVQALTHLVRQTGRKQLAASLGRFPGELLRVVPEIEELVPGLPRPLSSDPDTERYRLFDAVTSWIATTAERAPLVLVLDDIHWATKPTTLLLRHIIQDSDPTRLLIVGTYRDTDLGQGQTRPFTDFLRDLGRQPGVERIPVGGLDEAGVEAFLAAAAGHGLGEDEVALARAIHAHTDGNPFFTGEVVRHLIESRAIYQDDGRWVCDLDMARLGIPESVRDVVRRRLDRLDDQARQALTVASVIGLEFDFSLLSAAADLDEERLLTALEAALEARLLTELRGPVPRFRFAHVLVQTSLYEDITQLRRIRLHRRVGEAVEDIYGSRIGDHLSELAHHFAQVVAPVEADKAVGYAVRAGKQALAQLAHDEAARYFQQALDLLDATGAPEDTSRLDVLLALARAQWGAADLDAAKTSFSQAADVARRLGDADRLAEAALGRSGAIRPWWVMVGHVDKEAADLLAEALDLIDPDDSPLRVRVLGGLARELYFEHVPARREELSLEAVAMARRLGDEAALARALVARHTAGWTPDNVDERLAIADEILDLAGRLGDTEFALVARVFRCIAFVQKGDRSSFDAEVDSLARRVEELRLPFYRWLAGVLRTSQAFMGQHLQEAQMLAATTLQTGNEAQEDRNAAMLFGVHMYHLHQGMGRLGDLRPTVEAFAAEYPAIPAWRISLLTVCAQTSDRDSARPIFEDFADDNFAGVPRDWVWHVAMFHLVEGCAFLEDTRRAAILYDLLTPFEGQTVVVSFVMSSLGPIALQLGQLAALLSRWDAAERHFEDAIADAERQQAPGWVATAEYSYGRAWLRRTDSSSTARGRDLLRAAASRAESVGWTGVVEAATALLDEPA